MFGLTNRQELKTSLFKSWSKGFEDMAMLVKFKLTALVVFSSAMSYVIVSDFRLFRWVDFIYLLVGGFLVVGASNTINQVLEVDYDREMDRTRLRPLPAGRRSVVFALIFGGLMAFSGLISLSLVNIDAAFLGALAIVLYCFVYTPLKRVTPLAVLVGSIPGALPMAIGVIAYDVTLVQWALFLFVIQFLWQFPHFWAIGYLLHEDYQKAGFRFVPLSEDGMPSQRLGLESFLMSLSLVPIAALFMVNGLISAVSYVLLVTVTLGVVYTSFIFWRFPSAKSARTLLFSTFIFLPLVLFILLIFN